ILIVGAGEAGRIILSEYIRKNRIDDIAGFIDDDPEKAGKDIDGKPVISTRENLNNVITDYRINQVIIALPSVQVDIINQTVSAVIAADPDISIQILPKITRYFSSSLSKELEDVYLADLIDRKEVELDVDAIEEKFANKSVLITGAGGSIGSEICRQILRFDIKRMICVGRGENSIYNLIKSLNEYIEFIDIKPEIIYRIIDIKDKRLLESAFNLYKPDIVFHAAAHKHVPLMEFNEAEAVQNNIGGTINVLELSSAHNVQEFVFVSSDKAVRPVNVMGATKRAAEIITDYFFREKGLKTSIVRFGNVIGSRGSVIPLFREQIEKGGPVTVTHPEVTRYFMSIPEASLLVINAAAYCRGGECFVLDMGKQYRMLDIANNLIRLYGYEPDRDIKVIFTGLRPGEKLYEELSYDSERVTRTRNNKIFVIDAGQSDNGKIENFINHVLYDLHALDHGKTRELLSGFIPEYDFSGFNSSDGHSERLVN
ncbi:MAG: polysaccharide biosynthesis protein, partial [Spirochaetes bacterium]|nr:polysaccharide biosynthesis protein [Spirochaetota bacterium]